jgi:hypothetical protein
MAGPSIGCGQQLRALFLVLCVMSLMSLMRMSLIYNNTINTSSTETETDVNYKAFFAPPFNLVTVKHSNQEASIALAKMDSPSPRQQQTTSNSESPASDENLNSQLPPPTTTKAKATKAKKKVAKATKTKASATPDKDQRNGNSNNKTLSLLYPTGLMGGYRNQAMRFIGLVKHAIDEGYDRLLLPTLVWSTRYVNTRYLAKKPDFNPAVKFWPIPFDELFDVDHWNTFHHHRHESQNTTGSEGEREQFSLPRLVFSVDDDETNSNSNSVCWKPKTDDSIVSVPAIQRKKPKFAKSFLPLLTSRMLFGNNNNNDDGNKDDVDVDDESKNKRRDAFVLDPLQAEAMEFLTGDKMARKPHKLNLSKSVNHCTHPHVFGGASSKLWENYMKIYKTPESYPKLVETVDEALVPAKPWRILADRCVEYHLGLGDDEFMEEEEDPHALGHDHSYIALHARVEAEMLVHKCGKEMERNLTTILELVELLALDYNSETGGLPDFAKERARELSYSSPISNDLRQQLRNNNDNNDDDSKNKKRRHLKGAFVAVARDEFNDVESFPNIFNITSHNRGYLNQRSISYDKDGSELYTKILEAREREQKQRQAAASKGRRRLGEDDGAAPPQSKSNDSNNNNNNNNSNPLPVFECGDGWVKHAFYESEDRQKKLLTPSSSSELEKGYGLYHKYGPNNNKDGDENRSFPLLPLPEHYFGDILPSMLNFWLAVRADVFVGVKKSSWSTDVWTTRYYYGRGDRNFEYTSDRGILAIGNGGLPENHKNC